MVNGAAQCSYDGSTAQVELTKHQMAIFKNYVIQMFLECELKFPIKKRILCIRVFFRYNGYFTANVTDIFGCIDSHVPPLKHIGSPSTSSLLPVGGLHLHEHKNTRRNQVTQEIEECVCMH